jgi:NAD(P)H-hydrate epimerase
VQNLVSSFSPEVMTEGLPSVGGSISRSAVEQTLSILQGKNAAGMGPGLTTHDECVEFVKGIVRQSPVGLVLDADALNAFEGDVEEIQNQNDRPIVLTPHPGEFSRLTGVRTSALLENQIEITRDFCFQHRVWVVLKTFRPLIGTPSGDLYVSPCGNPGMATAGMGDVLTGIITSLLGQFCAQDLDKKEDVTSAVLIAVYLHGLAGDLALERLGPESLIAGDVSDAVSEAYREIWEARGK